MKLPRRRSVRTINPASHRTCPTGKVRLRDQHEATLLLTALRRKRAAALAEGLDTPRREDRSYECGLCEGWHLTSKPARDPYSAPAVLAPPLTA